MSMEWGALKQSAVALWRERRESERIALTCAAMVVVAALVYALVLAPVIAARQRLEESLPALRLQAAEMQMLAKDAGRYARDGATPPVVATRDTIEASLRDKGLKAQSITVDGGLARVQLTAVSFSSLLQWLDDARTSARLTVVDATIAAQPGADSVNAALTLQQQKSE